MAFTVTPNNNTTELLNTLLGETEGLSNFSLSITGDPVAVGLFEEDPFGLQSGIVLSTGNVAEIPGENQISFFDADLSTDFGEFGESGDAVNLQITFDASATSDQIFFQYVFGSEEFTEFGGSEFNDSFELLLNGENLAQLSDGQTVTINNLVPNGDDQSSFNSDYINNPEGVGTLTKLDGYTKVLTFEGNVNPGVQNTLTIQIQDVTDGSYDSAVFLKSGALGTVNPPPTNTATVQFSQPNYQVSENGNVVGSEITLNRTGDLSQPSQVEVQFTNGTATGGETLATGIDFKNTPISVDFDANEISKTIAVPINVDTEVEGNENLTLTLANPTAGTILGTQKTTNLEILENGSLPTVTLSLSNQTLSENNEEIIITATLSSRLTKDITINLQFGGDASGNGIDYRVSSESMIIAAGQTSSSISLTTIDDFLFEWDETIEVGISSIINATVAGINSVNARIIASDPQPLPDLTPIEKMPEPTPEPTPEPIPDPAPQPLATQKITLPDHCICEDLTPPQLGNNFLPNTTDQTRFGTEGDDIQTGDESNTSQFGGTGTDIVFGKEGDDNIYGGKGFEDSAGNPFETDILFGNEGKDFISGSEGSNKIYAGQEDDVVFGGKNPDLVYGDMGNDTLSGDLGNDTLIGDTDAVQLMLAGGKDLLFGGQGNDSLLGNDEDDTLDGGTENDIGRGGKGNDLLFGAGGDDQMYGDEDVDTLCGGEGNDTLYGNRDDSKSGLNVEDSDYLCGGKGDDFLSGNAGADQIWGDDGKDSLYGGEQNDTLLGGEGDDYLFGDGNDDILLGGFGNDTLQGGKGKDLFIITKNGETDTILDFTKGEDSIGLEEWIPYQNLTFTTSGDGMLEIRFKDDILAQIADISSLSQENFVQILK